MQCQSCKVEMEMGFLPDFGTAQAWVGVWIAGEPEMRKGVWEKIRKGAGVDLSTASAKAVDAHRCPKCGRLDLFATRDAEPGTHPARDVAA
jgi:hypothetical protein